MTLSGLSRSAAVESAWGSSRGAGPRKETRGVFIAWQSRRIDRSPRFPGDFAKKLWDRSALVAQPLGNRAISRENSNQPAAEGSDVTGTLAGTDASAIRIADVDWKMQQASGTGLPKVRLVADPGKRTFESNVKGEPSPASCTVPRPRPRAEGGPRRSNNR